MTVMVGKTNWQAAVLIVTKQIFRKLAFQSTSTSLKKKKTHKPPNYRFPLFNSKQQNYVCSILIPCKVKHLKPFCCHFQIIVNNMNKAYLPVQYTQTQSQGRLLT